jgi:hypothetical protein
MANYVSDPVHAARALIRARVFTAVCVVIAILLLLRLVTGTPPLTDCGSKAAPGTTSTCIACTVRCG